MIAIETRNLNKLVYSGLFSLKEFIKNNEESGYIETSLEYDNDILLNKHISKTTKILSKIPYLKDLDITVEFNRLSLGVEYNQLHVLLDAKTDWENPENKNEVLKISDKYRIGLYGVTNIDQILAFREGINTLDFIEVDLNPLLYPKSILDYSKENEITVISHDIFGGKYWAGYLEEMFPKGFLFDFARYNSGIQVIPGDDLYFLSGIAKRKVIEEESRLCNYSKDINKLPALSIPPQKIHGQTKITIPNVGEIVAECGESSDIYSLGESITEVKSENIIWEDKDEPETKDRGVLGSFHRYHSQVFLDEKYNPGWWKKIYTKIADDFWVIKLIPRHWYLGWIAKEYIFWMISGKLIKIPLKAHYNLINDNILK